jgi:hypothetical protein
MYYVLSEHANNIVILKENSNSFNSVSSIHLDVSTASDLSELVVVDKCNAWLGMWKFFKSIQGYCIVYICSVIIRYFTFLVTALVGWRCISEGSIGNVITTTQKKLQRKS